ncbi:hypothetical protein JB92DRAFT_2824972 [Gautieria morchelliformis]|nr:hypothetical protein JB92DRAFT_2824972 [Gautieria morchelliformis]
MTCYFAGQGWLRGVAYFGEQGWAVILTILEALFPPDTPLPNSTIPMSHEEFIQLVLVPEVTVELSNYAVGGLQGIAIIQKLVQLYSMDNSGVPFIYPWQAAWQART